MFQQVSWFKLKKLESALRRPPGGHSTLREILSLGGHRIPSLPVPTVANDVKPERNQQHGRSRVRYDGLGNRSDAEIQVHGLHLLSRCFDGRICLVEAMGWERNGIYVSLGKDQDAPE